MVTEIFKVKIGVVPDIMKKIFEIDNGNYSCIKLQHDFLLKGDNVRSVYYGTNKATFFIGPKIWDISPKVSEIILKSGFLKTVTTDYVKHIHHLGFL